MQVCCASVQWTHVQLCISGLRPCACWEGHVSDWESGKLLPGLLSHLLRTSFLLHTPHVSLSSELLHITPTIERPSANAR
jgi:hypothetical protein